MDSEKKETLDNEKIEMGFSIPDTETTNEENKKRIDLMDEKLAEGRPERPSQEDGGKAE